MGRGCPPSAGADLSSPSSPPCLPEHFCAWTCFVLIALGSGASARSQVAPGHASEPLSRSVPRAEAHCPVQTGR